MEKVLVVDDNPHNCELMSDLLANWGYDVKAIFQGMEAIAAVRSDCPDIILLDVMLPGMNGFEVCHEIKNNPETCHIPIIMLTVLSEAEDRIQGIKVGADYFLSKPINYNELKFRVAALLEQKQRIDSMEEGQAVVAAFLQMLKCKDESLYFHACQVREYCDKVSRLLSLSDRQQANLLWAASLHDIGKIIDPSPAHTEIGRQILSQLKMGKYLAELVYWHHTAPPWPTIELEIIATVDRFVNNLAHSPGKESCLERLRTENSVVSMRVVDALEQVLRDERFMENLTEQFQ